MPSPDPTPAPQGPGYALRFAGFMLALCFVATGVALMIEAELGVAPYDVLVTGSAGRMGLSVGTASIVVALIFLAAGLLLGGKLGVGTVVATFVVGPILNGVLALIPDLEAMAIRIPVFALGLLVVTSGIAGVVAARVGAGPVELFMLALHEGKLLPLTPVRAGIELGCVALGWALGGQVGVGTLVFAAVVPVLLRKALQLLRYEGPTDRAADIGAATA